MSQFRDTFTKEEKSESLYDDTAFFFFFGTIVICILIFWTYNVLSKVLCPTRKFNKKEFPKSTSNGSQIQYCKCSECVTHVENIRKKHRSFSNRFSLKMILQVVFLGIMWSITYYMLSKYSENRQIAQFNPYEILEISPSSNTVSIKKAYRLMSLKYHPDKNPNDPTAAAKFMLIAKAYQALTDEVARSNYEKYGNPDGPTSMKVGIGLPSFLVSKKYQLFILCFLSLIILFIIPLAFIIYYRRQKKYASNGVYLTTLYFYSAAISDSTRFKALPEILALSTEFRSLKKNSPEDDRAISQLANILPEFKKRSFNNNSPSFFKAYYLILAHLYRKHSELTPSLMKVLEGILAKSIPLTSSMLEISISRNFFHTSASILAFRRSLIHAIDGGPNASFLQIPYITENEVQHIKKGKTAARNFVDFIKQNPADRKGLAEFNESQKLDIEAFCNLISPIAVDSKVIVDDEQDIVVGDLGTIEISIDRTNLKTNEACGPVHSPYFPSTKYEEWWIFAATKGSNPQIIGYTRCSSNEKTIYGKIQFLIETPGSIDISLHLINDSYEGLDQQININFVAKTIKEGVRQIYVHPEDEALDNEPTLFQHIMNQLDDNQLSTDTEDEDDDTVERSSSKE
ncbi:DNAJ domain-containing protein [Cryptosporidium canis]|uniref:DNAJ domain-containing protein n=1 Tax=Cryptosporidium canis TaxID=195482 RepID=A0A9D5DK10_9CRYT|nr:DNAJ domain-containing protein [Cryptosporidium canis]